MPPFLKLSESATACHSTLSPVGASWEVARRPPVPPVISGWLPASCEDHCIAASLSSYHSTEECQEKSLVVLRVSRTGDSTSLFVIASHIRRCCIYYANAMAHFFVIVGKIHGHHAAYLLPCGEESITFTLRVVDTPRLGPLLGFPGLVRSGVLPPLRFSFLVRLAHSLSWASLRIEWMASTQKCLAQLHGSSLRPLSGRDPHACNPLWLDKPTPFYETVPMCLGGGNPWLDTSFDPGACCPR